MPSPKPLYSAFDKALESLLRNKGTGSEFLGELTKKAGVKQAEIQERGLDKALGSLPKVDKAEVQKIVRKNPPARIEVKTKMENPYLHPDFDEIRNEVVEQHTPYDDYGRPMRRFSESDADEMAVEALGGPAKYYEYQLPNSKNYREMLLQLPEDRNTYKNYYGPHWDEPNVLAHMRLSDRTGPNGEKVLHLEELQSDWHQQGRENGYQLPPEETAPMDSEYRALVHKNADAILAGLEPNPKDVERAKQLEAELIKSDTSKIPNAPFKKNWEELALKHLVNHAVENGYDKIAITPGAEQAKRFDLSKQISKVEYNPNELTLNAYDKNGRQVIRESGIEPHELDQYIGKDPAEKLRREVDNSTSLFNEYNIDRDPESGKYALYLYGEPSYDYGGQQLLFDSKSDARDHLRSIVDESISSNPPSISGLDLQVGGEGMKAAYDQRIPNILNKIGKPFGAQTKLNAMPVETGKQVMVPDNAGLGMISSGQPETANLHTFDVTPQLSEKAQTEGFPLYKRGGKVQISTNPDTHWAETKFKRK